MGHLCRVAASVVFSYTVTTTQALASRESQVGASRLSIWKPSIGKVFSQIRSGKVAKVSFSCLWARSNLQLLASCIWLFFLGPWAQGRFSFGFWDWNFFLFCRQRTETDNKTINCMNAMHSTFRHQKKACWQQLWTTKLSSTRSPFHGYFASCMSTTLSK